MHVLTYLSMNVTNFHFEKNFSLFLNFFYWVCTIIFFQKKSWECTFSLNSELNLDPLTESGMWCFMEDNEKWCWSSFIKIDLAGWEGALSSNKTILRGTFRSLSLVRYKFVLKPSTKRLFGSYKLLDGCNTGYNCNPILASFVTRKIFLIDWELN